MPISIPEKIDEYKLLKKSKKALEKRLAELRDGIVGVAWAGYDITKHGVSLQHRDLTTYDPYRVADLMALKGIPPEDFTRPEIDPSKIEELYLIGALTDDDLRYIRLPKYSYALVEVDNDVQE